MFLTRIHWLVIYPVDRVIQPSKHWPRAILDLAVLPAILGFHVTSSVFKFKITNFSEVLVSSDIRASKNLTFHNV